MVWTAAWTDFVICLLFGWLGVHKFREKKIGMGILYLCTFGLFCIGWFVDCIRYLLAAIHGERIQGNRPMQISADAPLPVVPSNVMLANGEVCHYCGPATFVKTKNVVVGYSGGSRGTSVRIAKVCRYILGREKQLQSVVTCRSVHREFFLLRIRELYFQQTKELSIRRFRHCQL